jgi:hypothetical protein
MHVRTFIETQIAQDQQDQIMASSNNISSPSLDKKDNLKDWSNADHVENREDQTSLSSGNLTYDCIEDTKVSNSVWLVTATVVMGGFLFGRLSLERNQERTRNGTPHLTTGV